jgi:hypothetical protein
MGVKLGFSLQGKHTLRVIDNRIQFLIRERHQISPTFFIKALHIALKIHQGETSYVVTNDNYPSIRHNAKVFKFIRF